MVEQKYTPPTAQSNLSKRIGNREGIEWINVYNRIYTNTIDTHLRMFQYKILNNILYLNFDLYRFKIIEFWTYSLCHSYPETVDHLFIECTEAINYYIEIENWLRSFGVFLPELNKLDILLGVDDVLVNFVILLYKYSLYRSREKNNMLSLLLFTNIILKYEQIERKIARSRNKIAYREKKMEKIIVTFRK